jgi:hypothetical protein
MLLLTGCSASLPVPLTVAPNIPAIPADVEACRQDPTQRPEGKLTAGETEKLWRTDRYRLMRVNGCFWRLICQYHEVRQEIGKVEDEPMCGPPAPTELQLRKENPIPRKQKRLE